MWKEVEQLQKKDLPQSVVSASMKIYDKAKAERDVPQMMMVSPLYTHTGTMYPFIVVVDC